MSQRRGRQHVKKRAKPSPTALRRRDQLREQARALTALHELLAALLYSVDGEATVTADDVTAAKAASVMYEERPDGTIRLYLQGKPTTEER